MISYTFTDTIKWNSVLLGCILGAEVSFKKRDLSMMNVKSLGLGLLILSLTGCGGFKASKVDALITIEAPEYTNQTSVDIFGKCDPKSTEPVTISGNFTGSPLTADCIEKAYTATITLHEETTTVVADQGEATANATIIFDDVPPVVAVTFPVPSGVIGSNVYVSGTCESGLEVELSGDMNRSVRTPCTDNQFIANVVMNIEPAGGPRTLNAQQTDRAGNVGTTTASYTFDNTAPGNPSLTLTVTNPYTSSNPVISTDTTPTLAGTVAGADNGRVHVYESSNCAGLPKATIVVPVGGALSATLSYASDGSDDGVKRYFARALGANGVASPSHCFNTGQSYRLDTQPPNVTLSSHANGARVRAGVQQTLRGACESGLPVTLKVGLETFTLNCNNRSYSRSLNMPNEFGPLTITYSQTDLVGNSFTGTTVIEITAQPDNTPPELNFINLSTGDQLIKGQLFVLTGLCDANIPLQISGSALAAPVNATCSSVGVFTASLTITQTVANNLVVEAQQTDLSGNQGKFNVRVRVINPPAGNGPYVTIASPLASSNFGVGAPIVISGLCQDGLTVKIEGMALAQESYTTSCTGSGTYSLTAEVGPDVGQDLLITASQFDGEFTGEYSTTINVVSAPTNPSPPPVKLISPLDAESYNINSQILVAGTCAYGLPVSISGSALLTSTQATCTNSGTFFEVMQVIGTPQNHASVVVTQVNSLGEVGLDIANLTVEENTEDTTAPNLTITTPANNSSHSISSVINVGGTCEGSSEVTIMGAAISGFHTVNCAAGVYSMPVPTVALGGNPLSIIVTQKDAVGNHKVASRNVRLTVPQDSTSPAVKITVPADGVTINRNSLVVVAGTCEEGLNVAITGNALVEGGSVMCQPSGTFSKVLTVSHIAAVNRTITATQRDAANNSGQSTVTFNVGSNPDVTAPAVTISSPAADSQHQNTSVIQISGSCQNGIPVYIMGSALSDSATANCNGGSYTTGVMASSSGGDNLDIIAYQMDAEGNVGVVSRTVNVFVVPNPNPPALTIDFPTPGQTYGRGGVIIIAGQCMPGYQVTASGSALQYQDVRASCSSGGSYSFITNLRNSAATNASIVVTQRDHFWRLKTAFVNVDVSSQSPPPAPEISIVNPSTNSVIDAGSTIPIQGVCATGGSDVYLLGTALGRTITVPCNSNSFSINARVVAYTQMNSSLIAIQVNSGALSYASNSIHVQRPPTPVPPVVTIQTPVNNATIVQSTKLTVTGSCTAGLSVDLFGTAITAPAAVNCRENNTYTTQLTITASIGTNKTLTARQVNIAGQSSEQTRNLNIIETPNLDIASPVAGASFIRGVAITVDGDCRPGVNVQVSGTAVATNTTTACDPNEGKFSANVTLVNTVSNNLKINVQQNIAAGFVAKDSVTINTVAIPVSPQVRISDPEDNSSHQSGSQIQITGTCTTGYNVTLKGTGLANPVTTPCDNDGRFLANVFVVTLQEPDPPEEPPEEEEEEEPGEEEEEEEESLIVRAEQSIGGSIGYDEITIRISRNSTIFHCGSNVMKSCSAGGRGKENNPYIITTYACLQNINVLSNRKCHYRIGANITAPSNSNWEPLGWSSFYPFTGSIDGAGRKIRNLKIHRPNDQAVGLIGYADGATIKNLTLENVEVSGRQYVGAFVGLGEYGTTIDNVHLRGKISVSGSASNAVGVYAGGVAGALVGSMRNSTINGDGNAQTGQDDEIIEIRANGTINTRYNSSAGHRAGGFVGEIIGNMSKNKVDASAVRLTVGGGISIAGNTDANAGHRVGGIAGRFSATSSAIDDDYTFFENSFAPGIVSPIVTGDIYIEGAGGGNGHRVGGLIGESGAGVISDSFILGINTTNVGGSFIGTPSTYYSSDSQRVAGHTVGFLIGSNVNSDLYMEKVYLEMPQDIEEAPIDPITGKPIYDVPELKISVGGNGGIHDVGGIMGETIKNRSIRDVHIQSAAMTIEVMSNRGNHVGGLIGSVYANSYSSSRTPRQYISIGYITGLNSVIEVNSGDGTYGNRVGGLIGRMHYTHNPSGSDKSNGFYMLGIGVDGYARVSTYGTNGEHYIGGLIGQMIEPHADDLSRSSRLERSFVSESAVLISDAPNTIMGGLIGEYRRLGGTYSSGSSTLRRSLYVMNTHSHASYVLPQTALTSPVASLGFLMGRCNMGSVNRNGVIVQIENSYGAPVDGVDIPLEMPRFAGVIGHAMGQVRGPEMCNVQNSRYGHQTNIPAQACVGGCAQNNVSGLTEAELRVQSNFPATWWVYNPPIWEMTPIPFLIVDPTLEVEE